MKPIVKDGILRAGERETAISPSDDHHSPEWCEWLAGHDQFRFIGEAGHFSARRESRKDCGDYWYAYRRRDSILHKAYLGKSSGRHRKGGRRELGRGSLLYPAGEV